MRTHTGRIIFTCQVCEFEATRQSMLDDHIEIKHTEKDLPPEKYDCRKCEQVFPTSLHLEYHICKPTYKYPCHVCEFMGLSVLEVLTHLNEDHVKCLKCNHMSKTKKDLDQHQILFFTSVNTGKLSIQTLCQYSILNQTTWPYPWGRVQKKKLMEFSI